VVDFLEEHPGETYVNRDTFLSCLHMIRPWMDISVLARYLMKYGVVKNSEDMEVLTSSYLKPQDRFNSLIRMVEQVGKDGFMLLYMCLKESSVETKGHGDAAAELQRYGN